MEQIQALRFDIEEVGKHVKSSKKRFQWDIALKNKQHSIVLDFSFISAKVKITVDRKILLENQLPSNTSFQYPFTLDGFALNVIQQGETFELRLNNKVFSHLYNQQKTNTEFKKYQDEVKDIRVDQSHFNPQNKKISLNIGAFDGMKKKAHQSPEASTGWNAFSGNGFPSYFGDNSSTSTAEQPKKQKASKQLKNSNLLFDESFSSEVKPSSEVKKSYDSILQFGDENKGQNFEGNQQLKSPSESHLLEMMSKQEASSIKSNNFQEFNSMQNMFNTLNLNSESCNKKSPEIDFFSEPTQPAHKQPIISMEVNSELFAQHVPPQLQEINQMFNLSSEKVNQENDIFHFNSEKPANQFNTMQNMFKTNLNTNNLNTNNVNTVNGNTTNSNNNPNKNGLNFNTNPNMNMNAFNTNSGYIKPTTQVQNNQFNQMFATTNLSGQANTFSFNNQFSAAGLSSNTSFAKKNSLNQPTNQPVNQSMNQPMNQSMNQPSSVQEINFIQQSNIPLNLNQPLNNLSSSQLQYQANNNQPNLNAVNINDFNTMQNLFQSNSFSNEFQLNSGGQPQKPVSQANNFNAVNNFQFLNQNANPNPSAFNTMSGSFAGNSSINASNFGTMQPNTNKDFDKNAFGSFGKTPAASQAASELI